MQTAVYGKIKESRETGGEWIIGTNTQNIPYFSIVATQHKTNQRRVRRLLMRVKGVVAQACKARKACIKDG